MTCPISPPEPVLAPEGETAPPFLLSLPEAAQRFGISVQVLGAMIAKGMLPCLDTGDQKHVNPDNVKAALKTHFVPKRKARRPRRFLGLLVRYPELRPVAQRLCTVLREAFDGEWFTIPSMLARFEEDHNALLAAAADDGGEVDAPYTGLECLAILQARSEERGLDTVAVPHPRVVGATLAMLALDDIGPLRLHGTRKRNPRFWSVLPAHQTPERK